MINRRAENGVRDVAGGSEAIDPVQEQAQHQEVDSH